VVDAVMDVVRDRPQVVHPQLDGAGRHRSADEGESQGLAVRREDRDDVDSHGIRAQCTEPARIEPARIKGSRIRVIEEPRRWLDDNAPRRDVDLQDEGSHEGNEHRA